MNYRVLGNTGIKVSEISLGTWQVGGKWGSGFNEQNAERILNTAVDKGINFIDTADVYENGLSEQAVGKLIKSRSEKIHIATKCGRFINPHVSQGYTPEILRGYVEQSLKNTGLECLDLVQLHCPPTEVYYRQEIFEMFDTLKQEGKILHLGVSVEKVEEALKAIEYPNVKTVQIIFNMFRHRPAELFFNQAKKRNIGVIARVPLASGLLTGKFTPSTAFLSEDHRSFNRKGEVFDKGETFSGVNFNEGLEAVNKLKAVFEAPEHLAQIALKWILMFEDVSCVIPGVSKLEQLHSNLESLDRPELTLAQMQSVKHIYEALIKPSVHHRW